MLSFTVAFTAGCTPKDETVRFDTDDVPEDVAEDVSEIKSDPVEDETDVENDPQEENVEEIVVEPEEPIEEFIEDPVEVAEDAIENSDDEAEVETETEDDVDTQESEEGAAEVDVEVDEDVSEDDELELDVEASDQGEELAETEEEFDEDLEDEEPAELPTEVLETDTAEQHDDEVQEHGRTEEGHQHEEEEKEEEGADLVQGEVEDVVELIEMPEVVENEEMEGGLTVSSFDGERLDTRLNYNVIRGIAPEGTHSIVINGYRLRLYYAGQTQWSYIASTDMQTLEEGLNTYEVEALDAEGNAIESATFTINYDMMIDHELPNVGSENLLLALMIASLSGAYVLTRRKKV